MTIKILRNLKLRTTQQRTHPLPAQALQRTRPPTVPPKQQQQQQNTTVFCDIRNRKWQAETSCLYIGGLSGCAVDLFISSVIACKFNDCYLLPNQWSNFRRLTWTIVSNLSDQVPKLSASYHPLWRTSLNVYISLPFGFLVYNRNFYFNSFKYELHMSIFVLLYTFLAWLLGSLLLGQFASSSSTNQNDISSEAMQAVVTKFYIIKHL